MYVRMCVVCKLRVLCGSLLTISFFSISYLHTHAHAHTHTHIYIYIYAHSDVRSAPSKGDLSRLLRNIREEAKCLHQHPQDVKVHPPFGFTKTAPNPHPFPRLDV